MIIITIAGLSGDKHQKIRYDCRLLGLEDGIYLNSLDVLTDMKEERYYILGTTEALKYQKTLFHEKFEREKLTIIYNLIDQNNNDEIFSIISGIIENSVPDEVIFIDISHGLRHHSMIASYAAMVVAFTGKYKIRLVYAKKEDSDHYCFIELNEYMDLTEYTFYLRIFYRTCSIGHYHGEDQLLRAMHHFGEDFLANSIQKLISESYPKLKKALESAKCLDHFTPLKGFIEKIEQKLSFLDRFSKIRTSKQYLELAKFSEGMNYSIIALTYLHESISLYICESMEEKYLTKKQQELNTYNKTQALRDKLRKINNGHPFLSLVDDIREMRNNLTHLSLDYGERHVKSLNIYINKVERFYKNDVLIFTLISEELQEISKEKPQAILEEKKIKMRLGKEKKSKKRSEDMLKDKELKMRLKKLEKKLNKYFKKASLKSYSYKFLIPHLLHDQLKASSQISRKSVMFINQMMSDPEVRNDVETYANLSGINTEKKSEFNGLKNVK